MPEAPITLDEDDVTRKIGTMMLTIWRQEKQIAALRSAPHPPDQAPDTGQGQQAPENVGEHAGAEGVEAMVVRRSSRAAGRPSGQGEPRDDEREADHGKHGTSEQTG